MCTTATAINPRFGRWRRGAAGLVLAASALAGASAAGVGVGVAAADNITVTPAKYPVGWWRYDGFSNWQNCISFVQKTYPGKDYWCTSANGGPWGVAVPYKVD